MSEIEEAAPTNAMSGGGIAGATAVGPKAAAAYKAGNKDGSKLARRKTFKEFINGSD